jgi:membrane protease YdiL (CAAX protease family)
VLLDRIVPRTELTLAPEDRQPAIVLLTATVLLVMFFYWGRPGFYYDAGIVAWVRSNASVLVAGDASVGAYLWWGATSLVFRVLAPVVIIVWVLRDRPSDYGFRVRGIARHMPAYGVMYLVMLPILVIVSGTESFLAYYPFYDNAAQGGLTFWLYELGYGFQFVGVEAFFRGFLTFGLYRRFGLLSVAIMTIPYTMIHFAKPMPEAFAAIVAGLILGVMAIRSKSFVPGIFLHVAVAITMDLLVLWRTGALANVL